MTFIAPLALGMAIGFVLALQVVEVQDRFYGGGENI